MSDIGPRPDGVREAAEMVVRKTCTAHEESGVPASVRAAVRHLIAALSAPPRDVIPRDVIRLIVAARVVAFDGYFDHVRDEQARAAMKELDQASEAFADRVPWEDEPNKEDSR